MKILGYNINIKRDLRGVPSNPKSQVPDAVVKSPGDESAGGLGLTSLINSTKGNPMGISAVYAAVNIISNTIASIPIQVKDRDKEGYEDVIHDHYLLPLFDYNENDITRFELIKYVVQSILLKGNGFIYVERDGVGKAKSLRWIPSENVTIVYNQTTNYLYYLCPLVSKKKIEPVNMLHFKINSNDGINGRSVILYANRTISNANYTEDSSINFYKSGCNLNGVIKVDGSLTPQQKQDIRDSWRESMNGNGLAVLQGNMDYSPIQMNVMDAQLIESRQFNVNDIARFFNINPTLLGDLTHSSYNTLEAAQEEFLVHTLTPYITVIEQEMTRKLFPPSERRYFINLQETAILRTDKSSQADYYTKLLEKGVLSINEVRKAMGYNEIEGGDRHTVAYTDINQNTIENNNEIKDNEDEKDRS